MNETWVSHKLVKPSKEAIQGRPLDVGEWKSGGPDVFTNTFEIDLAPNETFQTIWLKTKWRYKVATLYEGDRFLGDWYPEFNDMLSQLMTPIRLHDAYLKITGRDQPEEIVEGQVTFMLPLTISHNGPSTLECVSRVYKNFRLEYQFSQPAFETELYVEIVTRQNE